MHTKHTTKQEFNSPSWGQTVQVGGSDNHSCVLVGVHSLQMASHCSCRLSCVNRLNRSSRLFELDCSKKNCSNLCLPRLIQWGSLFSLYVGDE